MIEYIADREHYNKIVAKACAVKQSLWIATADLKDLYVDFGGERRPFLAVLDSLLRRGVEIRLLHAKEQGRAFAEDFDAFPRLWSSLERRLCPRVHFKMLIFDYEQVYIGSANMTGAGIGMKGENTRNFESGIFTDDTALIDRAAEHFECVWSGSRCSACRRKSFCGDPIDSTRIKRKRSLTK